MGSSRGIICRKCKAPIGPVGWIRSGFCDGCRVVWDAERRRAKSGLARTRRTNRVRAIVARDGEGCLFCGATDRLTIDHIRPLASGGTNAVANLRLLCWPCHAKRHGLGLSA